MVKVCKIWCNDVYMYILYCDIFCGNLSTVFVLFRFLIPGWYLRASHLLHMIISKQDIHICYIFHIYLTITLSSVLKPKYCLSIGNKCVYLLEASETSITKNTRILPKLLYLRCAMEKTARWNFLKLWQIMYLDITIQWCKS